MSGFPWAVLIATFLHSAAVAASGVEALLPSGANAVQDEKPVPDTTEKKADAADSAARVAYATACVETFVADSSITKREGETTVGGDPAANAAELKSRLLACVPPFTGVAELTLSNGMTVKLGFGEPATGAYDLCIGLGMDAGATAGSGGDACATNDQFGGAAIAIGGNGGAAGAGAGGNADATSNGGTAVAEGGRGGGEEGTEGGPGGSATATNNGGDSKTSKAKGGNGGARPRSDQKGGSGGDAAATSGKIGGGNWPGGAGEVGKFGYGGTAVTSGGRGAGSAVGGQGNN